MRVQEVVGGVPAGWVGCDEGRARRRTLKYFADMGDHEPGTDAFTWRWSQYFWKHKAAIGFGNAVAVARRAHLARPPRPRQWARVSRPSSVSYADILSSSPFH